MRQLWPVIAVVVAFAAIGLAGVLKPRPGDSAAAHVAQAKLDTLPIVLGDWQGVTTEIRPKHLQIAEAQAHLSRGYTRPRDRAQVSLLVLAGAPGPLGAHTPETCFAGAGYQPEGAAAKQDLPGDSGSLWRGRFHAPHGQGTAQDVYWGWSDGTKWIASSDPRFQFVSRNLLYKLYVTCGARPAESGRVAEEFLTALVPAMTALELE